MPRIADYLIIKDTRKVLSRNEGGDIDEDYDFTLESGAHLGSRAILGFNVFVPQASDNLKLEILVNGSSQRTYTFGGSPLRSMHEVVDANVLRAGTNNIKFHLKEGEGSLQYEDVVLHYQRDI